MTLFGRFRVLPLLLIVAGLSFAARAGEFVESARQAGNDRISTERSAPDPAALSALSPAAGDKKDKKKEKKEKSADKEAKQKQEKKSEDTKPNVKMPRLPSAWQDASESTFEHSPVREALYQDLTARREAIESKERELSVREALLEATEKELDSKLREMTALKEEIDGLLGQRDEAEQARINGLVKIYEGMKAKDAARIFNTLDMDVLLAVMGSMSERKSAPILAAMDAERARTVTILLSQEYATSPLLPDQGF